MARAPGKDDVVDIALVGGGIMSGTLGALFGTVDPSLTIRAFERLDAVALESSCAINNAGTGHAGNCELNYTPIGTDGNVSIGKACTINEKFEHSLQMWASMVEQGWVREASMIVNPVPHMSFVWGTSDVNFLKQRHAAMSAHPFFAGMTYSEDVAQIKEWAPLIMRGRDGDDKIAVTHMARGTDVNFGAVTNALFERLEGGENFELELGVDVTDIRRDSEGNWRLKAKRADTGSVEEVRAKFVFIGAGGRALPLLMKSGIPEGKGFGGFPVSGMWLYCKNREIVENHSVKVYGKAALGAPPMSVPHLDTRMLRGRKNLLFGPYAGFSTKFLKNGSFMDLFNSLKPSNIVPMIGAGMKNMGLTSYLIGQVLQSHSQRVQALRNYFPDASSDDWELRVAGQRVQIIKKDAKGKGILQFGTEIVVSEDRSFAALLGASPGASSSVALMLELLVKCFPEKAKTDQWQKALTALVPSFGKDLAQDSDELVKLRSRANSILGLTES